MIYRTDILQNPFTILSAAWMTFIIGILASGALFLTFPDDLGIKIFAMSLLVLFGAASTRFDLMHPFVWFGFSFLLYSIAAPFLIYLKVPPIPTRSVFKIEELDFSYTMDIQYIALLAALLVIGPGQLKYDRALSDDRREPFFFGIMPVLILAAVLSAISVVAIVAEGHTAKTDVILYGSWVTRLSFGFNILATCAVVYLVRQYQAERHVHANVFIAVIAALGVLVVLYTGQRDFLFRFLVVATFVVHVAHRRLTLRTIIPLAIVGAILITIMAGLKTVMLSGAGHNLDLEDVRTLFGLSSAYYQPLVNAESPLREYGTLVAVMALGSEFLTVGNNLALLFHLVPYEVPFQNGSTLVYDVVRAFTPGVFDFASKYPNSVQVFNELFFPKAAAAGIGEGFSLVGAGYFNFGLPGAILIMLVFGLAIRLLYRWSVRSPLGMFFYIGFIPIAMFTARSDPGVPISQGLKHVLVPLVLMLFIAALSTRRTPGLDRRIESDRRAAGTGPSRVSNRERRAGAGERRSRTDRRLYPRTSRKDRGRFSAPPEGEVD